MRFWRRKNEGFEWHKYVRTTILQRREQRRDQVQKAKQVAVEGIKAAGAAAVAGSRDSSLAVSRGLGWLTGAVLRGIRSATTAMVRWSVPALRWLIAGLAPARRLLGRPIVAAPVACVGLVAVVAALARMSAYVFTADVLATFGIGLFLLLVATWSWWSFGQSIRLPQWLDVWVPLGWGRYALAGVAAIAIGAGTWTLAAPRGGQLASLMPGLPFVSAPPIAGRGLVVSAEIVRIGKRHVRLAGIEAPEREQRCPLTAKRTWACGKAAEAALARMVRSKHLTCDISGTDDAGRPLGVCRDGPVEINAQLVKEGHVFAAEGMLARYSSQQAEAQRLKAGVWKGEAERPAAYRAKRWEDAKRKAPDGCPIKGQVASGGKIYVLPWSAKYDRVQVRTGRGERWFCSEREARDAGWQAAERG
jgi:endonuclease YncB( thermonuclease family)